MNEVIKAYLFIPSGFRNFIERGFAGWRFVFFLYVLFSAILALVSADSLREGIFIFLQPIFLLVILFLLSGLSAFIVGSDEPLVKGMRLVGLCLPPIGLTFYFLAEKSPLVVFAVYPALLFIFGSIFLSQNPRLINIIPGICVIGATGFLSHFNAVKTDKWFGRELTIVNYEVRLSKASLFSEIETGIYRFLLFATPRLGHIPQLEEITDSLGISRAAAVSALVSLDEKARIVIGADFEIRYAYPWASFDNGCDVLITERSGSVPRRVYAASALHALATPMLTENHPVIIVGRLRDSGQKIEIEIRDGKINATNFPEAQIYKGDVFSEMDFYSSPSGAKSSYRGRFDSTKLLDLERAMIVAEELIKKKAAGAL
jgi:hypothetical protein